jgi:hypothetical protein
MTGAYLSFSDPGHPWFTARRDVGVMRLGSDGCGFADRGGNPQNPVAETATRGTLTTLNDIVFQSGHGQPLTAVQEKHLTASVSAAAALLAVRLPTGV